VLLAHAVVELLAPALVVLAELRVLVAVGVIVLVFQPELAQGQVELLVVAQLVVDAIAVRRDTLSPGRRQRGRK
jgi:hypothetical protein